MTPDLVFDWASTLALLGWALLLVGVVFKPGVARQWLLQATAALPASDLSVWAGGFVAVLWTQGVSPPGHPKVKHGALTGQQTKRSGVPRG